MPREYSFASRRRETYRHHTHRPLNALIFIGPLLVFFHVGSASVRTGLLTPAYMRGVLEFFGVTGQYVAAALIVVVLLLQHLARHDPWSFQPKVLLGIAAESLAWTVPLWVFSQLTGRLDLRASAVAPAGGDLFGQVLVAVGAGIYEEFVFRMALISFLMLLLVDVLRIRKDPAGTASVLAAAVVFSLCHFSTAQLWGDQAFPWSRFVFLALAGTLWGVVYVFRGFAVAVGSHIVWDLYVIWSRMA